jgi:hypothetical protein
MICSGIKANFEAGKRIKVSHNSQGGTRTDLGDALGTAHLHLGDEVIVLSTYMRGSDEVKTVTADDAAVVLTVQDTSYRDGG